MPMGGTIIRSEPGFIPWTAIQRWVEVHDVGPEDAELLDQCFQAMDVEFKRWWTENNKVT